MREEWLPKELDAASTEQPRRNIALLHPTFRFIGPRPIGTPRTDDNRDEWYIIETAKVHNAHSLQTKFYDEIKGDIERLRYGDNLWGVSGVTNETHVRDVALICEDILVQERPGIYRSIGYNVPGAPDRFWCETT